MQVYFQFKDIVRVLLALHVCSFDVLPDPGSELLPAEIDAHSCSRGNDCITWLKCYLDFSNRDKHFGLFLLTALDCVLQKEIQQILMSHHSNVDFDDCPLWSWSTRWNIQWFMGSVAVIWGLLFKVFMVLNRQSEWIQLVKLLNTVSILHAHGANLT